MVLSPAHPRRRPAAGGPAVALAASLLAGGLAFAGPPAEGEGATASAVAAGDRAQSLPAPDSLARARVQARFDRAWRVRVFAGGDPVELAAPRAEPEGVRGVSVKERPAVVALDTQPAGEKLLRWEDLRRIEVGRPGAARGLLLGMTAGAAILLATVPYAGTNTDADLGHVTGTGMVTLAIGGALGLIFGLGHPLWTAIPF